MWKSRLWAGVFLLAVPSACTSIVGGGAAEAEVSVYADGGADALSGPALQSAEAFEGTIRIRLRAFLVSGPFPIAISGGDQEVEVDLTGGAPATLETFRLSPGIYHGVRVVFSDVRAELTAGLGSGESGGGGVVTVDLGDQGALTVEEDLQILLRDGLRLRVDLELRAPTWLTSVAANPHPRIVSAEDFLAAVQIDIRPE